MKANDIERLIFSPFHTSKILHYFLSGVMSVNDSGIKTELIYLVLPFIYNDSSQKILKNLNKSSKFNPFLKKPEIEVFLSKLNGIILSYRQKSNAAIIILANEIELLITDYIKPKDEIHYNNEKDDYLKPIYKSAFNLGVLLGKEQYLTLSNKCHCCVAVHDIFGFVARYTDV